ncbi:exocyst subunit exo70 family protein E2 [Striga hermonthica]|uniref:Exocyst subunit Exo70 family protein n=1 Tax=Striga hermonthica TaxID=68872 RepID=A0A9N7RPI1_STRHE|nr:exocyst subunit exo70 family protein E2 [Striga hermonthica]
MDGTFDREHHLIAAAHHLAKALESTTDLNHDTKWLLSDLSAHLSRAIELGKAHRAHNSSTAEIEARLMSAAQTITRLHSNHPKIWDAGHTTISEYLKAVAEVQRLTLSLEDMDLPKTSRELLDRAQNTLHSAMARLEDELAHALIRSKQGFLEHTEYEDSLVSNEDDSVRTGRFSSSESDVGYETDLVHPDSIPHIKSIAGLMFGSGYGREFCWVFTGFWRNVLAEHVAATLGFEQLSIEDVLRMEWELMNSRIRKWRAAVRGIIGTHLVAMKRLFDLVLGKYGDPITSSACLVEASRAPVMRLLNFGLAVSIGPHRPEWLFCLLDMYETLTGLQPEIDALFPDETGPSIRADFHDLLMRLGDSAMAIYRELENHISLCSSTTPLASGGVHPITKYVMNYVTFFVDYGETLERLFRAQDAGPGPNIPDHLRSLTSALEANLNWKSNLYNDRPLKHVFMMNNIHYMVRKVRESPVEQQFGDEWVKAHIGKFRHHATCYERETWGPVLDLLRDDRRVGKSGQKGMCRAFAAAFEGVYKRQTRWWVPDLQLREELKIKATKMVIHAYRDFLGRAGSSVCEKHVKYSEHELGTYILDLLEGSPKSI